MKDSSRDFCEIEKSVVTPKVNSPGARHPERQLQQIDMASLLERLEGDHELLAELVHLFLADVPHALKTIRDALNRGDMPSVERTAHSLKGAAGSLSAQVAAGAASRLEQNARDGNIEFSRVELAAVENAFEHLIPILLSLCNGVSK